MEQPQTYLTDAEVAEIEADFAANPTRMSPEAKERIWQAMDAERKRLAEPDAETRLTALETVCERQSKRIRELQAQVARLEKLVASHASHGRVEVL